MLLLASKSPRRRQLLEMVNIPFTFIDQESDESFNALDDPKSIVRELALRKASACMALSKEEDYILAADTLVVLDGHILGKPDGEEDAFKMLSSLSCREHEVITGVAICSAKNNFVFEETTQVFFHSITPEQIWYYIKHFKPMDKAGAYGIQDWMGAVGIKKIIGDFYNVMGLPIARVVQYLRDVKYI